MLTITREWNEKEVCHVWATLDEESHELTLYEPYKDLATIIGEIKKNGYAVFHRRGVWHAYRTKKQIPLDWIIAGEVNKNASFEELAAAMKKQFPNIDSGRLNRAVELCNAPTIAGANIVQNSDTLWRVRSQHTRHEWYTVSTARPSCTCPDSQAGNLCKHRIAVQLFRQRRQLQQQPQQQPASAAALLRSLGYE